MHIHALTTLVFALSWLGFTVCTCPRQEDIRPCFCKGPSSTGKFNIYCRKLDNEITLLNVVKALRAVGHVFAFSIEDSTLSFIPHDTFQGLKLDELLIINTNLMALTDTDIAFYGLEDNLHMLLMKNCTFMNQWDWHILRNLKVLQNLYIESSGLDSLPQDITEMNFPKLEQVSFPRNLIEVINDVALAHFSNMRTLTLNNNRIKVLKRSMLPRPALQLVHLDLGFNQIERFPVDMFVDMPALGALMINNNRILVLDKDTFSPIWEKLKLFYALDNALRCDCRMSWVLNLRSPAQLSGTCTAPPQVQGKKISQLASKDLWC